MITPEFRNKKRAKSPFFIYSYDQSLESNSGSALNRSATNP